MNTLSQKFQKLILLGLFASMAIQPLNAADSIGDKVNSLISSCPWVGLVAPEVTYGPITVRKLKIEKAGRLAFTQPGAKVKGSLKYKIDASKLDSWDLHHIVVGLRNVDSQNCIVHSLGVWNKKGKASFTIQAPEEKGIYEVCFAYYPAVFCEEAVKEWKANPPAHNATIGIIVVE